MESCGALEGWVYVRERMAERTTGPPSSMKKKLLAKVQSRAASLIRTYVSADAKYIVKNLVLWFLIAPIVLGILGTVLHNATH